VESYSNFINQMELRRAALKYEIDGVVEKARTGWTGRSAGVLYHVIPVGAIAQVPGAEGPTTIVQGIDIQVGRTGALTPWRNCGR